MQWKRINEHFVTFIENICLCKLCFAFYYFFIFVVLKRTGFFVVVAAAAMSMLLLIISERNVRHRQRVIKPPGGNAFNRRSRTGCGLASSGRRQHPWR